MSRQHVHELLVARISLLQGERDMSQPFDLEKNQDSEQELELSILFNLHTKLFEKCKQVAELFLATLSDPEKSEEAKGHARTNLKRALSDRGLRLIFEWQASYAEHPN